MKITGETKLYALLGSPVAHSISPLLHNAAFEAREIHAAYLCFDVTEDSLDAAVRGLQAIGASGFNLTMPNKTRMVGLLDEVSDAVALTGATNTVTVEDGRLVGHNTDGLGFVRALRESGFEPAGATAAILGAGGASAAICAQLALEDAKEIHIFLRESSRHTPRARELARGIQEKTDCAVELHEVSGGEDNFVRATDLLPVFDGVGFLSSPETTSRSLQAPAIPPKTASPTLLVNATPIGMGADRDRSPVSDIDSLPPGLFVADAIYEPRETRLLREAKEHGCRTMSGLPMLLYQAAEAFRIWTGQDMPTQCFDILKEI